MILSVFWGKIRKKLLHVCFQPIRVFCFHQVSDEFNPNKSFKSDWTQIEQFKSNIINLQKQYSFITLNEAYERLKHDRFRFRNYAVLTSDDGYASLLQILPWLEKQKIPVTLFLNTQYLDGKHFMKELYVKAKGNSPEITEVEFANNLYLSESDVAGLNSKWVSLGMHGHEHVSCRNMSQEAFEKQFLTCWRALKKFPGFVPFYAYTFGHHTSEQDKFLIENGIVPVGIDGQNNYNEDIFIHRICIDMQYLKQS